MQLQSRVHERLFGKLMRSSGRLSIRIDTNRMAETRLYLAAVITFLGQAETSRPVRKKWDVAL